jgi:hypothetical protein
LSASEIAKREDETALRSVALPQHRYQHYETICSCHLNALCSDEGLTAEQKQQVKDFLKPIVAIRKNVTTVGEEAEETPAIDEKPRKKKGKWARKAKAHGTQGDAMGIFGEYSGIYPETAEFAYAYESDGVRTNFKFRG